MSRIAKPKHLAVRKVIFGENPPRGQEHATEAAAWSPGGGGLRLIMRRCRTGMAAALLGCIDIYGCAALRGKIGPEPGSPRTGLSPWGGDEAEPEGCGGPTVKGENEVWPDFHRNPGPQTCELCTFGQKSKGRGHFPSFRRRSSLADTRYPPHGLRPVRGGPGMRRSSLLELRKNGSRRCTPVYVDTP